MGAPRPKNADARPNASPVRDGRSRGERVFLVLLAALTAFVVVGHLRTYTVRGFVPEDFGAFYCAGRVVLQRRDPYRVEPLLDCERRTGVLRARGDTTVIPVPLPSYDFVPLAALAAFPVRVAVMIFAVLLIAATATVAYCLTRMSALPLVAAFAIVFMGLTYAASPLGQISPLTAAALAAGALFLRVGKHRCAALAASATLLQPQVGLPVVAATFLFVPRARLVIAASLAAALVGGIAAVGIHGVLEYPSVLSVHARSEVNAPIQYSLTWLVHALGVSAGSALLMGALSYAALSATGLIILAASGQRAVTTGAVLLLPAAFSVFGGTFVHNTEIAIALLAAIVLVRPKPVLISPMLPAALLTVSFWSTQHTTPAALPSLLLTVIAVGCVVFYLARPLGMRAVTKGALMDAVMILGLITLMLAVRHSYATGPAETADIVRAAGTAQDPNAFASFAAIQLRNAEARDDRTPLSYYLLLKFPTWSGVAMTLWLSCVALLTSETHARRVRWTATTRKLRASPS
jgi:hypothetical protein